MTPPTGEPSVRERLRPLVTQRIAPLRRHMAAGALHLALVAAAILAFRAQWYLALVPFWCVIAWMDHAALTRLHEAAHAMLVRNRVINEILGIAIGTASLTPLAVYRYVHHQHHAYLGREPDPEFWPYNLPGSPRWVRLAYAWAELFGGWLLTPVLYSLRTAAAWSSIKPHQRQRLAMEWAILVVVWAGVLTACALLDWWAYFLVGHLAPAWLAGTMQTIRKFTEHLGMHGKGILGMTRTVIYQGPAGELASRSQLHVEHHATHHRHARIPYHVLPEATEIVYGEETQALVFPNHARAMLHMLPALLDPKLGPQWLTGPQGSGQADPDRVCPS